ncbi:DUF1127 domain-containing protein [Roseovarius salinarum]|uniref:DUF1127 domain-containing protein n=1 Tax=Roseovarius salinarum TaxID=1981892 RepID=UPI000C33038C|nr:DUF1127 domain-containing protein [Roseovarius salinarum]
MTLLEQTRRRAGCPPARRHGLRALAALFRQRQALRRLEDAALADLGLTRDEAEREARRAPWDVPDSWRC